MPFGSVSCDTPPGLPHWQNFNIDIEDLYHRFSGVELRIQPVERDSVPLHPQTRNRLKHEISEAMSANALEPAHTVYLWLLLGTDHGTAEFGFGVWLNPTQQC